MLEGAVLLLSAEIIVESTEDDFEPGKKSDGVDADSIRVVPLACIWEILDAREVLRPKLDT